MHQVDKRSVPSTIKQNSPMNAKKNDVGKALQAFLNIEKNGLQNADFSFLDISRAVNHRAMEKVIEPIIREFVNLEHSLEIGCGFFPTRELLPSYPEEIKDKMVLTEFNHSQIQKMREKYPKASVQFLDFKNITLEKSSFQSIIMQDVLNCHDKEAIVTAAKQIHNILAKGGYCIHFCKGSIQSCITDLVDHNTVMFPTLDDQKKWIGLNIIKIEDLKNQLKKIKSRYPDIYLDFSQLTTKSAWERMEYLHDPMLRRELTENFEKLACPDFKTITFEDHFFNTMKKGFGDAGFEMVRSTTEKGVYFGLRDKQEQPKYPNANFFQTSYKSDKEEKEFRPFAPFHVSEVAEIHIFVCQKK